MLFSAPMFWKMVLCGGDADLSGVARTLLTNRSLLVYSDSFQRTASQKTGFAVGVIGNQALVVAVFVS